ncbi:MAG: hypothetical protein ACO1SV_27660 [Fimbriimonas sp.]
MQTIKDIGTLTVGGANLLATLEDVQWEAEGEFDDYQNAVLFRKASQPVKSSARMTVPLRSIKTGQTRVSHMDLSVAALVGMDVRPELESINLSVSNPINPIPNQGEFKRRYQCDPGGTITADVAMEVADSASVALALMALLESDDPDDLAAVLAFTLNGSGVSVPGHLRRGSHTAPKRQKVTIGFEGSDPSGTYPTAPVGTTTLLEKAINVPKTPLAFTYASHATEGLTRTGFLLIETANATIEDARITRESYAFRVSAPWTTALN